MILNAIETAIYSKLMDDDGFTSTDASEVLDLGISSDKFFPQQLEWVRGALLDLRISDEEKGREYAKVFPGLMDAFYLAEAPTSFVGHGEKGFIQYTYLKARIDTACNFFDGVNGDVSAAVKSIKRLIEIVYSHGSVTFYGALLKGQLKANLTKLAENLKKPGCLAKLPADFRGQAKDFGGRLLQYLAPEPGGYLRTRV